MYLLFPYTRLYNNHALFFSCFSTLFNAPRYISLLFLFTTLYIAHALFPRVSLNNTVYHQRSLSPLFQYPTLYINHALFLSCFNTQNHVHPRYFSVVFSAEHTITPRTISLIFRTQHCIPPTIYFPPVPIHNTVYHPRSISLLF